MQRRHFIKQLGLAATLSWLSRAAFAATEKQMDSARHKILSCNVRVDVPADSKTGDGWADRKEMCTEIIKAQRPDLIGLQEVQAIHLKDLKERMPDFESYGLSNPEPAFNPGDAIFFSRTRYELISAGGFWLSETPHVAGSKSWDTARSRFANWVQLNDRSSGKELRFWNTHLDHIGHEARAKGAALIAQASQALPKELPQILTGDMNAGIAHPAIKNLKDGGWIDTHEEVNGTDDPGATFHGFKGPKAAEKKTKAKIDWIFYRGPVKPLSAGIIRDGRNGHWPSDHYFVSAEVSL